MSIIKKIEAGVQDIVYYTSAFTEHYTHYITECNKPSKQYRHSFADAAFRRAHKSANYAISVCEELGLDPAVVCRDQVNFMDSYKDKLVA